jgi:hypothetical protein
MKHLLISLGLLLIASTTYGQITISNDSILDNANYLGRYTVQRVATSEGERVFVNFIIDQLLAADQKNQMENTIQLKLSTESETKGMRFYFFNYSIPSQEIQKNVITILTDSIMLNSEFIGRYKIFRPYFSEDRMNLVISLVVLLDSKQKKEIESILISAVSSKKPLLKFYIEFTYVLDESGLTPTQVGGLRLVEAGKAYNGAAALSIIGSAGGTALVLIGYPIVGSVITLSSGVIAFIVQIRGNNKLIKGGKALQKQRAVK